MKLNRYRGDDPPSSPVKTELNQARRLVKRGEPVWANLGRGSRDLYEVLGIGRCYVYYRSEGFYTTISSRQTYYTVGTVEK